MAAVNVTFPGNLAQVATANELRGIPSTVVQQGVTYIVADLKGLFLYDPGSLAEDDGETVLQPFDKTPQQAGRWLYTASGFARGPAGDPGPIETSDLAPAPSDLSNLKVFGFASNASQYAISTGRFITADVNGHLAIGTTAASNGLAEIKTTAVSQPATRGLVVSHYANGVGSYGIDLRAYAGASTAQVIHVYSGFTPQTPNEGVGLQIDHTKTGTMLVLKNDENPDTSPGTKGSADFLTLTGYGGQNKDQRVTNLMTWQATNTILLPDAYSPLTFSGAGVVINGTTGTLGSPLAVNGSKVGQYAVNISAKDNGLQVVTDTSGSNTLNLVKSGSADGNVIHVVNGGFGPIMQAINGALAQKMAIDANGNYFVGTNKVLGAQGASLPANATDLASALTLLNAIKARMIDHGLVAA